MAADQVVSFPQSSAPDQYGGSSSEACFNLRLDDCTFNWTIGISRQLQHLSLCQDGLDEVADVGAVQCRDGNSLYVTAVVFKLLNVNF